MISFKAPVGSNGIYDIYMRYRDDGTASYKLPVLVSGTKTNGRDITVNIGVDNDTLAILNTERFAVNREDLWFRQLPEKLLLVQLGQVCGEGRTEHSPLPH